MRVFACHSQARRTYAGNSCFEGLKQSVRLKSKTKENKLFDFLGRLHPSKPTIRKALLDFWSRLNMEGSELWSLLEEFEKFPPEFDDDVGALGA